jgi:hypothetical protein
MTGRFAERYGPRAFVAGASTGIGAALSHEAAAGAERADDGAGRSPRRLPGTGRHAGPRRLMADEDFYRRQTPMRRPGRPDELAGAVSFLVGPDSTYVSGVSLLVDGALTARLPSPYLTAEHATA